MKIALCSPLTKPEPAFTKSFDDLKLCLGAQHDIFTVHTYGVTGVEYVRNKITEQALQHEPDYLFWVDDDMMFGNDVVERLLETKKDFVCAEMFSKTPPFLPTFKKKVGEGILDYNTYIDYPENSLFEIACCGMAATLIHRRVFEDLQRKDKLGNPYWFASKEFETEESEDYNFCFRAREKGHNIWCDSSVTTRHIGGVGIGRENREYFKRNPEARLF